MSKSKKCTRAAKAAAKKREIEQHRKLIESCNGNVSSFKNRLLLKTA